ncbi:MAG: flavocytochrome c [Treponema sp.]|nr:flavocytochrome c [Treponema sp.]
MNFKQFKRIATGTFLAASAVALATLAACAKKPAGQSFTGTGDGRNGKIEISITVSNGKIIDGKVVSHSETPGISDPALTGIIEQMKKTGSADNLDTISGATLTSNGMIKAIQNAYAASQGKSTEVAKMSDTSCDIVIIGAGGAGLVAATEAANKGAKVIVLEKMGVVGGNTNSATGGINASYTKEQERLGIIDSKEVFFEDTMKGGKNINDPDLVHTLVDNSAAIVEWLQSDIVGADLSDVGLFGGATNKRIHRPQGGGAIGAHLVPLLYKAAQTQGADIRLNNKVTDIIAENGKPVGVSVESENGNYKVTAKAIIIATGGFGANSDMVVKYQPGLAGFGTTNHKGATGDAFAWIEKFNGALFQIEQIQTHPTVVPNNGTMITEAVRGNGAVLINREGKRFGNEMATRDVMSADVLKQTGKTAFLVFDQGVRDSLKAINGYVKSGLTKEAPTLAELAATLNIPADAFEATIKQYNEYVKAKKDPDFGRNPNSFTRSYKNAEGKQIDEDCQIARGPFYAIEIAPAIHHTMGGIKINPKAEVQTKDGTSVPGLYAAGEVTGGVHGANRLGGNAVADICIFGKIAADSALSYIGK